jgi:phospholipid/cholesterol/gamma-HCH transport system substrate-binding protein
MNKKHLAEKVGLFVFVCLVLLAALLVMFSKGVTKFEHSYLIRLHSTDAGGIKPGANVLLAGYAIGNVSDLVLAEDGESVTILLKIREQYSIRSSAVFAMEQAGFLGDQFVAVYPGQDRTAPFLEPGAEVSCPPPFNLQETAREAGGLIKRLDNTVDNLNGAISDVRRWVLNERTLTNLAGASDNLYTMTERGLQTLASVDDIIAENGPKLGLSVSNVVTFSSELSGLAENFSDLVAMNGDQLTIAMKNLSSASESLKELANDLQSGKGLIGTLIRDETLSQNIQALAANLSETSSNLNQRGIWGILWSQKKTAPETKK